MGTTVTDIDMELKLKISRIKYLESKNSCDCKYNYKCIYFFST